MDFEISYDCRIVTKSVLCKILLDVLLQHLGVLSVIIIAELQCDILLFVLE